jgi:hypothetical protein
MKRTAMFVAGALLSLAAFGVQAPSETEQRYKGKYGRYTRAEETRQKAGAKAEAPACCRNMTALFKNEAPDSFSEALFRAKFGRSTPRVEAREKAVAETNVKHVRACVELGKCTLMQAEGKVITSQKHTTAGSSRDEFYGAKYDRALPGTPEEIHSAAKVSCEHECCRRSD